MATMHMAATQGTFIELPLILAIWEGGTPSNFNWGALHFLDWADVTGNTWVDMSSSGSK